MQGKVSAAGSRAGLGQGPSSRGPSAPARCGDGAGPGCDGRSVRAAGQGFSGEGSELVHQALAPVQSPPPETGTISLCFPQGSVPAGETRQAEGAVCSEGL